MTGGVDAGMTGRVDVGMTGSVDVGMTYYIGSRLRGYDKKFTNLLLLKRPALTDAGSGF